MKRQILFAAAALLCAGTVCAAQQYTTAPVAMNRTQTGVFLGKVGAATPVTVLEKKGGKARVRVSGWTLVEYPSQIFSDAGVRIEYASFDEESAVKTDPKAGEKTVQENKWVKATAEGWIDAKALTGDVNALWKAGKERLNEACSMCHAAPKPDHFTANQWASVLPERGGRTGHTRAGVNAVMFKYLQAHAKK